MSPVPPSMTWYSIEVTQESQLPSGPWQCSRMPESLLLSARVPQVFSPHLYSNFRW
jgi:hypothetical protein